MRKEDATVVICGVAILLEQRQIYAENLTCRAESDIWLLNTVEQNYVKFTEPVRRISPGGSTRA